MARGTFHGSPSFPCLVVVSKPGAMIVIPRITFFFSKPTQPLHPLHSTHLIGPRPWCHHQSVWIYRFQPSLVVHVKDRVIGGEGRCSVGKKGIARMVFCWPINTIFHRWTTIQSGWMSTIASKWHLRVMIVAESLSRWDTLQRGNANKRIHLGPPIVIALQVHLSSQTCRLQDIEFAQEMEVYARDLLLYRTYVPPNAGLAITKS